MKLLIVAAFALAPLPVLADSYPTIGHLYSRDDDSVLSYICDQPQAQRLRCEFIQTTVSKRATPEDLERKLAEAREVFPRVATDLAVPEQCEMFRALLAVSSGQITAEAALQQFPDMASEPVEFTKSINQFRDEVKSNPDLLKVPRAIVDMCDSPSEETYLNFTRSTHEKDLKTCSVTARTFTEEFAWVPGSSNDGAWIVSAQPEGLCGVLQLSRFEKERSDTTGLLWRYVARRVVSNPTGELIPGSSCSTLDQGEQVFDWKRTRSDYMQCDFINFSPF